ncbi:hypothetical protein GCM10027417_11820 [Glutamicibacter endophyticus]
MEHPSSPPPVTSAPHRANARGALMLAYRAASAAVILLGIIRITHIFSSSPTWNSFTFYTVLSNILCLAWMGYLAAISVSGGWAQLVRHAPQRLARRGAAVMMAITVTMLVYLFVLVPVAFTQDSGYVPFSLTDNLIHIITPALVILDWILFAPKGWLRWSEPVRWCLVPYLYLAFAFTYGSLGGEFYPGKTYPYPFMNIAQFGAGGVAVRILMLTAVLVALGYLYVLADRLFARLERQKAFEAH